MRLRFTSCCAGAVLLHAGLLALGSRGESALSPAAPSVFGSRETEVELLAPESIEPERAAPPVRSEPPPTPSVAPVEPEVVARAARSRSDAPATASASAAPALDAAVPSAVSSAAPTVAPDAAAEPPHRKRLSPADLGLFPSSGVFLPQMQDTPPTAPTARTDPGQLRDSQMARDTELGLGPGGAVASAVRASAYDLAPLGSQATISVDLDREGSISGVSLVDVSSNDTAWNALLRALRKDLARLAVKNDRPLRVTLLLTNRSTKRAGNSGGLLDFDLSNIGSPTIQSLHVRVLAQTPL
jgi:hypothetical protein